MSTETREAEIKSEIKKYKDMLTVPNNNIETETWIGLQLIELRKELKIIRNEKKQNPQ